MGIVYDSTTSIDATTALRIDLFRRRATQLDENWKSLMGENTQIDFQYSFDGVQKFDSIVFEYDIHRLKGLYLDFRVFFNPREPTSYLRMLNLLKSNFKHSEVIEVADRLKMWWTNVTETEKWMGEKFLDICDLMFNSSLFHNDEEKLKKKIMLVDRISERALHSVMLDGIFFRSQAINVVHRIVVGTSMINQRIILS